MKRTSLILIVSTLLFSCLTSCKKDYTCECTSSNGAEDKIISREILDAKKSDAKTSCYIGNNQVIQYNDTITVTCELK